MLTVTFRDSWVDCQRFEEALEGNRLHEGADSDVRFVFPVGCKVMVDAGIRVLSIANQLVSATKRVALVFSEGEPGTMGYLNRIGFFDQLAGAVDVEPARPVVSGAEMYRGQSPGVVEIASIAPSGAGGDLPSRLSNSLQSARTDEEQAERLGLAAFTVFAELIQNIKEHADTPIDGYAALQVYAGSKKAKVAVSDSGKGILATLRPSLASWNPRLATATDTEIVVEAFRAGLSRFGVARGCGLKASADHALKYKADLDVRLPCCRVHLHPSSDGYQPHRALCSERLPLMWGTHICFDFGLDK
jgi:hypothetical protein